MVLRELIGRLNNPMRLLIVTTDGTELFKGYRGNYDINQDAEARVTAIELFTEITPRPKGRLPEELKLLASTENGQPLPDQITEMSFCDLSHRIFQKITISK